ncbi:hypothetical protein N7532_003998 [Penicillium argentinense]|uniref:Uncharacterized protein n=1 Tax=Penicillium argentinense TaxID=1131581 RepID=A0A9W9KEH7_9EURO|nr:uncharacterized protein N7532_003998 [Penicillium argentinense]KAJ5103469.1 hypothetical protein N7532_003998 [Penicillium argentinense]
MQSTTMPFSPIKDGRRILGAKDTNACFSPARQNKQSSVTGTPTKRTLFTNVSPKKLLPSPIFAGQKRTRDQVCEVEINTERGQTPRGSEEPSSQATVKMDTPKSSHVSDAMEARVSTPTSQPERDETTEDQTKAGRPPTASQSPEQDTRAIPDDPDARKIFIQEKAALLRNTLQTAMRNVPSNPIDRRVSELEAHSRKCPRISFSALSTPSVSLRNVATPSQYRTPRIGTTNDDMSSTPVQYTPDLPGRPSSLIDTSSCAKRARRTPPRTLGSPMQLSSPPATVVRHNRTREVSEEPRHEKGSETRQGLSPSQRGDAVDGLLKLMSNNQESSDAWTG